MRQVKWVAACLGMLIFVGGITGQAAERGRSGKVKLSKNSPLADLELSAAQQEAVKAVLVRHATKMREIMKLPLAERAAARAKCQECYAELKTAMGEANYRKYEAKRRASIRTSLVRNRSERAALVEAGKRKTAAKKAEFERQAGKPAKASK